MAGDEVKIYPIYSPIPNQTLRQWRSPIRHLAALEPSQRTLLAGHFNGLEVLAITGWGLQLHIPRGELTRTEQGSRDSTIDHA